MLEKHRERKKLRRTLSKEGEMSINRQSINMHEILFDKRRRRLESIRNKIPLESGRKKGHFVHTPNADRKTNDGKKTGTETRRLMRWNGRRMDWKSRGRRH
jgi:hypothetical protein